MTTETLIQGLQDILDGRINAEAILDLAPTLIDRLRLLIVQEKLQPFVGNNHVYICGKVTGLHRAEAFSKFTEAEQHLRGMGYKTINPMVIVPAAYSWDNAMRLCIIEMMKHCNKIYYLDNWTNESEGSRIENMLANGLRFQNIQLSDTLKQAI